LSNFKEWEISKKNSATWISQLASLPNILQKRRQARGLNVQEEIVKKPLLSMIPFADLVAVIFRHVSSLGNPLPLVIIIDAKDASTKCMRHKLKSFNLSTVPYATRRLILENLDKGMTRIDLKDIIFG
jgi:hypothetical protein